MRMYLVYRQYPDAEIYHTPIYFQSDWLNEYWCNQSSEDDYKFVYIGPMGSWYVTIVNTVCSFFL